MAKVTTRTRKRERKNITSGIAHVNATFNNTMITITDVQGNAYAGLGLTAVEYQISTMPMINFRQLGTVGVTPRYGAAAAMTVNQEMISSKR